MNRARSQELPDAPSGEPGNLRVIQHGQDVLRFVVRPDVHWSLNASSATGLVRIAAAAATAKIRVARLFVASEL
jgi:hypothetical protein